MCVGGGVCDTWRSEWRLARIMAHKQRSEDKLGCLSLLQLCFEIGYLVAFCCICQIRWPTSFKVFPCLLFLLVIKCWDHKHTDASAFCGFQGSDLRSLQALYPLSHFQSPRILYSKSSRDWR